MDAQRVRCLFPCVGTRGQDLGVGVAVQGQPDVPVCGGHTGQQRAVRAGVLWVLGVEGRSVGL